MRFFEFTTQPGSDTLSKLVDLAKDPKTDPNLKNQIMLLLKQLENKEQDQPTKEAVQMDLLSKIESDEEYYQRILNSDPRLKAIAEKMIKDAESAAFDLGAQAGREEGGSDNFNAKLKQSIQNLSQLPDNIKSNLRSICFTLSDTEDPAVILDFLNKCSLPERLIDMPSIVSSSGSGKLSIDPKYKNIASTIINKLKTASSSHAGEGPGEWFLVLAGKDTAKASPGDIIVNEKTPVEVKSSGVSAQGQPIDFTTANADVLAARSIFVNAINDFSGNELFQDAEKKYGGISSISTRNIKQLNEIFAQMGEQKTKELFTKMFQVALGKDYKLVLNDVNQVIEAIGPNGIDIQKWIIAMKNLAFSVYQASYKFKALISINADNLNYTVSTSAEDFSKSSSVTMGSLFDFRPRMSALTSFKQT